MKPITRTLNTVGLLLAISATATLLSHGLSALAVGTTETIPDQLPYHGVLYQDGEAVNGEITMTFRVYDGAAATDATWTESQTVQVSSGRFSVALGKSQDITGWAQGNDDLYLEVAMKTPSGETVTLPHRRRLVSSPAAVLSKLFTNGTVGPELRLTSAAELSSSDDDAPIVVRDGDGHMLKIDGNQIDSDTTLHLQQRSGMGVTATGDLDVKAGNIYLYSSNGSGGLAFRMKSNGDLEINPNEDFSKTVFDSDFTRVDGFNGLTASTLALSGCSSVVFETEFGDQASGILDSDCPDNKVMTGGRFEGNYSGAKAVYVQTCCGVSISVQ